MKKLFVLFALAAMVLGAAGLAHALDVKAKGQFVANYTYWTNYNNPFQDGSSNVDTQHNSMQHRARLYMDFRANENVNMQVAFEIGDVTWGKSGSGSMGGDVSADGKSVEVKRAYLEFKMPGYTSLITTVGTMGAVFPSSGYFGGSAIFDDDITGITVANKWNDMVSTVFGYWRLDNKEGGAAGTDKTTMNTDVDAELLAVPLTFDGVKVSPFVALVEYGANSNVAALTTSNLSSIASANGQNLDDQGTVWYAGSGFNISLLDPFIIYADFNYGSLSAKDTKSERAGWIADAAVEYKGLSWFTPSVLGWYASGLSSSSSDSDGRMPVVDGSWMASNMLNPGGRMLNDDSTTINYTGTWGLGFKLMDISFMKDLSHDIGFAWYTGTNDKDATKGGAFGMQYGHDLTTKDNVYAIDFNNTYKLMENLSVLADLGIAIPDFDKDTWRSTAGSAVDNQKTMWRVSTGFVYNF
ncbi:hypothetical protein dsx2_0764 [Desulfovibrio sp. X2]|uniref:outer membrane homotrimeric porin n=1 Tax=Desulfovibrio sp. X2 TaxID=941449 RepID=UPI0003589E68|nr:outer membrane homotrimeric porin [Desulfovibrio sp. X2]EPR37418.1 hypothetical protein dsx2_0764 [Desulfovibrio sp. X2]